MTKTPAAVTITSLRAQVRAMEAQGRSKDDPELAAAWKLLGSMRSEAAWARKSRKMAKEAAALKARLEAHGPPIMHKLSPGAGGGVMKLYPTDKPGHYLTEKGQEITTIDTGYDSAGCYSHSQACRDAAGSITGVPGCDCLRRSVTHVKAPDESW